MSKREPRNKVVTKIESADIQNASADNVKKTAAGTAAESVPKVKPTASAAEAAARARNAARQAEIAGKQAEAEAASKVTKVDPSKVEQAGGKPQAAEQVEAQGADARKPAEIMDSVPPQHKVYVRKDDPGLNKKIIRNVDDYERFVGDRKSEDNSGDQPAGTNAGSAPAALNSIGINRQSIAESENAAAEPKHKVAQIRDVDAFAESNDIASDKVRKKKKKKAKKNRSFNGPGNIEGKAETQVSSAKEREEDVKPVEPVLQENKADENTVIPVKKSDVQPVPAPMPEPGEKFEKAENSSGRVEIIDEELDLDDGEFDEDQAPAGKSRKMLIILIAVIILIIALVVAVVFITKNRSSNDETVTSGTGYSESETTSAEVVIPTEETTTAAYEELPAASVEEASLLDCDECAITLKSVDAENELGFSITVELQNKTEESLVFATKYGVVEGLSIDPGWSCMVTAGSTRESVITFYKTDYQEYGLTFTDVKMVFEVSDTTEDHNQITQQAVRMYPYGEKSAVSYKRTAESGDVVLMSNDTLKMTVVDYIEDETWGYSAKVYIENKSDTNIWLTGSDVKVNGREIDPYWGTKVPSGCSAYALISWTPEQFKTNKIDSVTSIEMNISVTNYDDWEEHVITEETIKMEP